jgi:hypothetical protein
MKKKRGSRLSLNHETLHMITGKAVVPSNACGGTAQTTGHTFAGATGCACTITCANTCGCSQTCATHCE